MNIGAVILAGGKSCRMGSDKAALRFGGQSFLERAISALEGFDEIILSTNNRAPYDAYGLPVVNDIYPGCGPIGGLHAALSACSSDALFCVTCDMPLFEAPLAAHLCAQFRADLDAVVAVSRDGYLHPLCAVYRKTAAAVFERQIRAGRNKITDAYTQMRVRYAPLADTPYADTLLLNVNTPEELAQLRTVYESAADKGGAE